MNNGGKQTPPSQMFVFDIESCDHVDYLDYQPPYQRAWLSGFMNVESEEIEMFTNLEECLKTLLSKGGNQNSEVGVHNLSFDGSFIVPALIGLGYTPTQDKPKVNEFSVLIDDRNSWYTITVQVTRKRRVTFWDTLKLFPMPLKDLPNLYHTPTQKLSESSEFYNQLRLLDHEVTEQEKDYFINDLKVLREVLLKHIEYEGLTFKKTQASQAFYNFTQGFRAWKLRFPSLSEELDKFIRSAYLGGISYVNPLHEGKIIHHIVGIDINSSYPYEISDKPLPYGPMNRETYNTPPAFNLFWIAEAIVKFKLKDNKLPCIAKRELSVEMLNMDKLKNIKWLTDSNGLVQMKFSSIDFITFQESYEFEVVEWLTVYHWAKKRQKELREFVLKNNEDKIRYGQLAKTEQDTTLKNEYLSKRQRAKINNNAFYGKFGEEILKTSKIIVQNSLGHVDYESGQEELQTPYKRKYLPVAIAITAYARAHLVRVANLLGEDFIYCDTDSIYYRSEGHYKLEEAVERGLLKFDDHELGAWSQEGFYLRGKFLRPKTYIVESYNKERVLEQYVTCAGLPADKGEPFGSKKRSSLNFENFELGSVIKGGNGKLRPILTPTGKKLVSVDFEIGGNKLVDF